MKAARRFLITLLFTAILFTSSTSHAGIPVFDGANLAQQIQQVVSWVQQYKQMVDQLTQLQQQYQQMQQQYQSLTGVRNLGNIYNNQQLQDVVPQNLSNVYNSINTGGYNSLTSDAKNLRSANMIYNCEDRTGQSKLACEAILNLPSQSLAYDQNALSLTQQRVAQIQSLQNSINSTQDPKAIAELQARIQAENVQVSNDANRIAIMQSMAAAQQRAAAQAQNERVLKMLTKNAPSAIDSFVYVMP